MSVYVPRFHRTRRCECVLSLNARTALSLRGAFITHSLTHSLSRLSLSSFSRENTHEKRDRAKKGTVKGAAAAHVAAANCAHTKERGEEREAREESLLHHCTLISHNTSMRVKAGRGETQHHQHHSSMPQRDSVVVSLLLACGVARR